MLLFGLSWLSDKTLRTIIRKGYFLLTFADGHASLCTVYSHPAARRAVNRELELGSPPLTPSLPLPAQPSPLQSISSPPTPFTFTTDAPHLLLDFLLRQKLQSKTVLSENSKPGKTLQEVDQVNNANSAIIFLTNLLSVSVVRVVHLVRAVVERVRVVRVVQVVNLVHVVQMVMVV